MTLENIHRITCINRMKTDFLGRIRVVLDEEFEVGSMRGQEARVDIFECLLQFGGSYSRSVGISSCWCSSVEKEFKWSLRER